MVVKSKNLTPGPYLLSTDSNKILTRGIFLQLKNLDWSELLGEEFSMFNILQQDDNIQNLQLC